ncbi:hypothetical protein Lfu02_69850 [Longispora fulva]|nr:hypothetical protein Lfu02_69850 [Longispora fulva]
MLVLAGCAARPAAPVPAGAPGPAPSAGSGFDPTVRFASFGWLPDGLVTRTVTIERGTDSAFTIEAGKPTSSIGPRVVATFSRPGARRASCVADHVIAGASAGATTEPAPAINGHPAS